MIKEGKYEQYINTILPYQYRKGLIPRKRLWEICPNAIKQDCGTLSKQEIEQFVAYGKDADEDNGEKSIGRLKQMTAHTYYEICETCYTAARFKDIEGLSARPGLLYRTQKNGQNPSHMWEISMFSTAQIIFMVD